MTRSSKFSFTNSSAKVKNAKMGSPSDDDEDDKPIGKRKIPQPAQNGKGSKLPRRSR